MQSIFWLKVWCVPLINPIISEELTVGTRRLAEVATIRKLKEQSPQSEFWLSLLDGNVYQYGVETTLMGIVTLTDIGYAPEKREQIREENEDG